MAIEDTWKIQLTEGSLAGLPVGITYDCGFIHFSFRFPKQGLTKQKQPTIDLQVSYYAKSKNRV